LEDLLRNPEIQSWFEDEVKRIGVAFAKFEQPKRLLLRAKPFTQDEGTLTPSLKIIRGKVLERLASDIEAIYNRDVSGIAIAKH
jgi:long-chain acyl-CoA synthetase